MNNHNKLCLVTGGTGGIGIAISKSLSEKGYIVVSTCRNEKTKDISFLKDNLFRNYNNIHIHPVDVTSYDSCSKLINTISKQYGVISILVNNAGITSDSSFKKMNLDKWNTVIDCNLNSMFYLSKLTFESMCLQKWGRIINIASINAQKGQFGQVNYASAKAGVLGFTKSLAAEGASHGVTVNSISPGYIDTKMISNISQDIKSKILSEIPIGRFGFPKEIAHAVKFIVDDDAGFVTGSNIAVNGGQHMY